MTHHLTEAEFDALLAGRASRTIREHVTECAVCAEVWQDVQRAHEWMRRAEAVPAPADFHARVMAALDEEALASQWEWKSSPRTLWVTGLGLALLAAGGGLTVLTVILLGRFILAPALGVLAHIAYLSARFGLHLFHVLLLVGKAVVVTPWIVPMLVLALALTLLAMWTTRFYSRRLYA